MKSIVFGWRVIHSDTDLWGADGLGKTEIRICVRRERAMWFN